MCEPSSVQFISAPVPVEFIPRGISERVFPMRAIDHALRARPGNSKTTAILWRDIRNGKQAAGISRTGSSKICLCVG